MVQALQRLAGVKWQRFQFRLAENLLSCVPPSLSQEEVSAELRCVFNASNRAEADRLLELMIPKYEKSASPLARYLLFEGGPDGSKSAIRAVAFNLSWLLDGRDPSKMLSEPAEPRS